MLIVLLLSLNVTFGFLTSIIVFIDGLLGFLFLPIPLDNVGKAESSLLWSSGGQIIELESFSVTSRRSLDCNGSDFEQHGCWESPFSTIKELPLSCLT